MTVRELRSWLFEISDQEQEIDGDDINRIIGFANKYNSIEAKIDELTEEKITPAFIGKWQQAKREAMQEITKYGQNNR